MTDTTTETSKRTFRMQRLRYEFVLKAEQPISHAEGSYGNESCVMRESIRLPGGTFASVPVVSGDTMRHGMREAAAYASLDAAGLLNTEPWLSEEALRLLFNGGMITGRGDSGTISLDVYREMTELIPSLKVLGGCANNRAIQGTSEVDQALLICDETGDIIGRQAPWVMSWLAENNERISPSRGHIESVQRVRMDSALIPEKRALLSPEAQMRVNAKMLASETAHDDDDALDREKNKSGMLPRRHETVKRGSLFFWGADFRVYNDLDLDTVLVMLGVFLSRAKVGGKKATWHGLLRPLVGNAVRGPELVIRSSAPHVSALPSGLIDMDEVAATEAAPGERRVGDLFREHVAARKDRLRELLRRVDA